MSTNKGSLLLVDDEEDILTVLSSFLERSGFKVSTAANGELALKKIEQETPDLVVLDILMPGLDGREVLRRLRQRSFITPVIMLTRVGNATERALALEEGADDYLNKPFDAHELLARINAVLRRVKAGEPSLASAWELVSENICLDRRERALFVKNKQVLLTPKAFDLLEFMMVHPGELLTRERLLESVWGWEYPLVTRTVDARIVELRRVLQDDPSIPIYIETVPGNGYRFIAAVGIKK